jgi:hypothetical protein
MSEWIKFKIEWDNYQSTTEMDITLPTGKRAVIIVDGD